MRKETNSIADLKPDERNPRKHNPRNIGMIERALNEVGAARSIVIDEENRVLAGNGVIEAAANAGIEKVRVVEADGNEIIAVRRAGLTEEQKRKLVYYDNRTAELASWDVEQIKLDLDAGLDLGSMWTGLELAALDARLPEFDNYIERFQDGQKSGASEKDGNWFYVEFYGQDELFQELRNLLSSMVRTAHQLDSEGFVEMVRYYAARKSSKATP